MIKWINKKRNTKGFTLIELIVVIAILGILAAIAIPRFTDVTKSSKIGAALANHKTVTSAVSLAQADSGGTLPATGIATLANYISGGDSAVAGTTWTVAGTTGTIVTTVEGQHTKFPAGTVGNVVTTLVGTTTVFTSTFN